MATFISPLSSVDSQAQLGADVYIGPFCLVGPGVKLGDGCRLDSHVVLTGNTTIGNENRFWPNCVIGAEPQDKSYVDSSTSVVIGDHNQFREGVTVNRGAEKEDGVTRIGNWNLLMSNAHVAHNCHIFDHTILVNGVLLGGHVHVHDRAIISGNSVVHHFSTVGTLAFVSGGCRVPRDIPPYMLAAGSDNPELKTLNLIGMQRAGIPTRTIGVIRQAFKLLVREHQPLDEVRQHFLSEIPEGLPRELAVLLDFVERTNQGRMGRAREAARTAPLVVKKDAA
ncbi:MAG: acyl-ACP--UDP-N-acetylglucosamine O-acyltransferase [Planctomycetaceae bacterium]|nr:acyl-ACP--UDP-N-acetylglucosamine O-acyltransferase [Planctomycetaceae bacterium]